VPREEHHHYKYQSLLKFFDLGFNIFEREMLITSQRWYE